MPKPRGEPYKVSEQVRRNMSAAATRRFADPAARKHMSECTKGRVPTKETRELIRLGNLKHYAKRARPVIMHNAERTRADSTYEMALFLQEFGYVGRARVKEVTAKAVSNNVRRSIKFGHRYLGYYFEYDD